MMDLVDEIIEKCNKQYYKEFEKIVRHKMEQLKIAAYMKGEYSLLECLINNRLGDLEKYGYSISVVQQFNTPTTQIEADRIIVETKLDADQIKIKVMKNIIEV